MRTLIAGVLLLAGCDIALGLDPRPPDAVGTGVDAATCFGKSDNGAGLLRVCLAALPAVPAVVEARVNTDDSAICHQVEIQNDGAGTTACVIAGTTIDIVNSIEAVGTRPLVLVATERLTVAAGVVIDASSHRTTGLEGAGASVASCFDAMQDGATDARGGAGGAGGSFGSFGGDGGDGSMQNAPNSFGGNQRAAVILISVRGGCRGGGGGGGVRPLAGAPGDGGGAVYLIAGETLEVRGTINASGEGGGGGFLDTSGNGGSGGGGGGSGGLIGLDAPTIEVADTARLVANGGGGGGGGGTGASATDGRSGSMADPVFGAPPFTARAGEGGTPGGSRGGGGGHRDIVRGGNGDNASFAAGGGGGSVGYIRIYATTRMIHPAAVISPPPNP